MKNRSKINAILPLAALLVGGQAIADELPVPRGPNIERLAGNCAIGPFGQVAKAGYYNAYCDVLTDAEKCLALLKGHMSSDGVLNSATWHQERVTYCLETFRQGLLGDAQE